MRFFNHFLTTLLFLNVFWLKLSLAADIVLSDDASIKYIQSGKTESLNKGQKYFFNSQEPAMIEKEGRIPVLIIPVTSKTEVQIQQPLINDTQKNIDPEALKASMMQSMSFLTIEIFQIQKEISNGQLQVAQSKLEKLQTKFPDVTALDFLSASVLLLESKKKEAISRLENALKNYPDYPDGQSLLKVLKDEQGVKK